MSPSLWKRWLPMLLVAEVAGLMVVAGWAVHRRGALQAPPPRITPAEWPYTQAGNPAGATRIVAPPVPFRTDHPPAGAFNLRSIGPEDATDHSRRNLEVRSPRAPVLPELPPDTRTFEPSGATVYYQPLGH